MWEKIQLSRQTITQSWLGFPPVPHIHNSHVDSPYIKTVSVQFLLQEVRLDIGQSLLLDGLQDVPHVLLLLFMLEVLGVYGYQEGTGIIKVAVVQRSDGYPVVDSLVVLIVTGVDYVPPALLPHVFSIVHDEDDLLVSNQDVVERLLGQTGVLVSRDDPLRSEEVFTLWLCEQVGELLPEVFAYVLCVLSCPLSVNVNVEPRDNLFQKLSHERAQLYQVSDACSMNDQAIVQLEHYFVTSEVLHAMDDGIVQVQNQNQLLVLLQLLGELGFQPLQETPTTDHSIGLNGNRLPGYGDISMAGQANVVFHLLVKADCLSDSQDYLITVLRVAKVDNPSSEVKTDLILARQAQNLTGRELLVQRHIPIDFGVEVRQCLEILFCESDLLLVFIGEQLIPTNLTGLDLV